MPIPGLQVGPASIFISFLTSTSNPPLTPGSAPDRPSAPVTARRLTLSCPLDSWTSLVAAAPLLPCGTATITSGSQLMSVLSDMQPQHERLLLTIGANITLPASPTPQTGWRSPYTTSSSSSATIKDGDAVHSDDLNPLVVIYRNVTLVGLANAMAWPGGVGRKPTELNLCGRRNAFQLLQPDTANHTARSAGGSGRIVLVLSDLTLVNIPPGPPATWPVGLLASDMYHVGLDRSPGAPVQLIHVRMILVLNPGQTKYFSYWYTRSLSVVEEEKASAAWILEIVTPAVPYLAADGSIWQRGLTRTFLEKYNVVATQVPLATVPDPVAVDLWTVEYPPAAPVVIGFANSAADLAADLGRTWTGPRVVVLLGNVTLDPAVWPQDGIQLAASATIAGPAAFPFPPSPEQLARHPVPFMPEVQVNGGSFLKVPPGSKISFRNVLVWNLSVHISWALPEAPEVLPGVPGYAAWRSRCLPGFMDNVNGRNEMHGCIVEVPSDVFGLLRAYNSPLCSTADQASDPVNCTSSVNALAATPLTIPPQLATFMDRMFRASGPVPVVQIDNSTLLFKSHTLIGSLLNNTYFLRLPYSPYLPAGPSSVPAPAAASDASSSVVRLICSLQTLFSMLGAAQQASPPPAVRTAAESATPPTSSSSSVLAAAIGGAVAGAVLIVLLAALAVFVTRRLTSPTRSPSSESSKVKNADVAALKANDGGRGDAEEQTNTSALSVTGCLQECRTLAQAHLYGIGDGSGGAAAAAAAAASGKAATVTAMPAGNGSGALPGKQAAYLDGAEVGADDEPMCCSAFSQSFAQADQAYGKHPTMFEQLLRNTGLPARQHDLRHDGMGALSSARVLNLGPGASGRPPSQNNNATNNPNTNPMNNGTPALAQPNNGNNNCNGGINGNNNNDDNTETVGAATIATGSTSFSAHRALAGEIDGMIRKYEAGSAGPNSAQSQGPSQRQRVLGSGGFGVVYKGEWRGLPVAIKVVLLQEGDSAVRRERLVREVALSATLSHPNVVATYHYTVQAVNTAASSMMGGPMAAFLGTSVRPSPRPGADLATTGGAAAAPTAGAGALYDTASGGAGEDEVHAYKLSIVMAFCDKGTLKQALRGGVFRKPWPLPGPSNLGLPAPPSSGTSRGSGGEDGGGGGGDGGAYGGHLPSRNRRRLEPISCNGGATGGAGAARGSVGGSSGTLSSNVSTGEAGAAAVAPALPRVFGMPPPPGRVASGPGPGGKALRGPLPSALRVPQVGTVFAAVGAAAAAAVATTAAGGAAAGDGPLPNAAAPAGGGDGASPRCMKVPGVLEPAYCDSTVVGKLTWQDVKPAANQALALFAALDIARGLGYLHSCNVVHGDISLQNILLSSSEPIFSDALLNASLGGGSGGASLGPQSGGSGATAAAGAATGQLRAPASVMSQRRSVAAAVAAAAAAPFGSTLGMQGPSQRVLATGLVAGPTADSAPASGADDDDGGVGADAILATLALPGSLPESKPVPEATGTEPAAAEGGPAAVDADGSRSSAPAATVVVVVNDNNPNGSPAAGTAGETAAADGGGGCSHSGNVAVADVSYSVYDKVMATARNTAADASADEELVAEPLAATVSTGIGSGMTWPTLVEMWENTPGQSATGLGAGGARPTPLARRIAAVEPLLAQVFKISDFGLSVRLEGDETHRSGLHQGTPYYTATEVLVSGKISPAADVYSYGVCLWCLVHGLSLCQLRHLLPPIFTPVAPALLANMSPDLTPGVRSLLQRCLAGDPARRPSAVALLVELQALVQGAVGPELAPLLLGTERRERQVARTVAGLGQLDSVASTLGGNNN